MPVLMKYIHVLTMRYIAYKFTCCLSISFSQTIVFGWVHVCMYMYIHRSPLHKASPFQRMYAHVYALQPDHKTSLFIIFASLLYMMGLVYWWHVDPGDLTCTCRVHVYIYWGSFTNVGMPWMYSKTFLDPKPWKKAKFWQIYVCWI